MSARRIAPGPERDIHFWVAPATPIFDSVGDVVGSLHSVCLPLELKNLRREAGWRLEGRDMDSRFRASGYTPYLRRPPLDAGTTDVLKDRAVRAFHAPACRGLLRVDLFLPDPGPAAGLAESIINEVNTFPGFTSASQYPRNWRQAGVEFAALLGILISGALVEHDRVKPGESPRPH